MLTRLLKLLSLQIVLILSLLLAACGEGDRKFVPIADDEIEEEPLPIVITAAGVKGPLINAEIGLYALDLNAGLIKKHGDASEAFFRLLTGASVVINSADCVNNPLTDCVSTTNGVTEAEALAYIQRELKKYGYVTELPRLQNDVKVSQNLIEAKQAIENYLDSHHENYETNTLPRADVKEISESFATLTELKSKIALLKPLLIQLGESKNLSNAQSLLQKFRTAETDPLKIEGWADIQSEFRSGTTSLRALRTDLSDRVLALSGNNALEEDPVAFHRLYTLEDAVNKAATVDDAESLIAQAIIEEGNERVRNALSALKTRIITFHDFINKAERDNAIYHFAEIKKNILTEISRHLEPNGEPLLNPNGSAIEVLNALYSAAFNRLSDELEPSLSDAFKNVSTDINGDPSNQLAKGISKGTSLLSGLNISDYSGFVYMEVVSTTTTVDLNTGQKPIISRLNSIFHTDEIRGYGNNAKENRTVYFLKDGQEQRDVKGELITDSAEVDNEADEVVIQVNPSRFATPLTKLAVAMITERFKTFKPQLTDVNDDSELEYRVTVSALKSELKAASNNIVSTFGLGFDSALSIYDAPAVMTLPMQYSEPEQGVAVKYRAMIESFSALINSLLQETNLSSEAIFDVVVQDFTDDEIDGFLFDQEIEIEDTSSNGASIKLNDISDVSYLVKRSPEDVYIPGVNKTISEVADLMALQAKVIEPTFNEQSLAIRDITHASPSGGVDSDGDGYLNNNDMFPNDADHHITLGGNYLGVWGLNVANAHNYIVPFSGEFSFSIERVVQVIETSSNTACSSSRASCLFEGSLGSSFNTEWKVIRGPVGGDLQIRDTFSNNDEIGFAAIGSVSGVYQVRLTLTTIDEPIQKYSRTIAVEIMNPQDLVIRFNPEEPSAGEIVKVEFQATNDLCEAYSFCDENHQGEYYDIDYLTELRAAWNLNGGVKKQYRSFELISADPNADSLQYFNSSNGDILNIDVVYSAGSETLGFVEFVAAQLSKVVGLKTDIDNDNITDDIDAFPTNSACYRKADGFINTLGLEECNYNYINNETSQNTFTRDISFNNETWTYDRNWNRIFRSVTESDGIIDSETRFFASIDLSDQNIPNKAISDILVDAETKRAYIVYENGEIDYFSFEDKQLHDFVDSNENIPVVSILPVGLAVLVEYQDGIEPSEFILYQRNGKLSVIKATSNYPKPGASVDLEIDGRPISEFSQTFDLAWTLSRLINDQPTDIAITTSDDSLTLLSGQTNYGDLLSVSFSDETGVIVKEIQIAVLDTLDFRLDKTTYKTTENLTISALAYDLSSDEAKQFINVKWLKYDEQKDSNEFQALDLDFPYSYSAGSDTNGDIITAEVYLNTGANTGLLLESEFALILQEDLVNGFIFEYAEDPVFDPANKEGFQVQISNPTADNKYFADHFTVSWELDGVELEGENNLIFPSNPATQIKYGSHLRVIFNYKIGDNIGKTQPIDVESFDIDLLATTFNLSPTFPKPGDDITIDYSDFAEDALIQYIPKWFINGKEDKAVTSLIYPGELLEYGDHIALKLTESDNDPNDNVLPAEFSHVAEVYVGVNVLRTQLQAGLDTDGDGVLNRDDYFRHDPACYAESDGQPDDIDGDGLNDLNELFPIDPLNRSIPKVVDSDEDGLSDHAEYLNGTNPNDADSDNDGFTDGYEVNKLSTDPLNAAIPGNADDDLDRDGVLNETELLLGTFVNKADSDNDGLFDGMEIAKGTEPLNPDTDGDGLSDGVEVDITRTNPLSADFDGDLLSDGVEVRLLNFNPIDVDSNDNGVPDNQEPAAINVGVLPQGDYLNPDDLQDYIYGTPASMVPAGTCYSTWLGQQELDRTTVSHELQVDSNSEQQILFSQYEWSEVIRYDAKNGTFIQPLTSQSIKGNISALDYDVSNINIQYYGYLNGMVRRYNASTDELVDLFNAGVSVKIEHIIDQGSYLLVETFNEGAGNYTHYLISKTALDPVSTVPVAVATSDISYKNSVWVDETARSERILIGEETINTRLRLETIQTVNPQSISQSVLTNTNGMSLKTPIFIEALDNEVGLNFASGQVLNLTTDIWLDEVSQFELGLQHDALRIVVPTYTSQVLRSYKDTLTSFTEWSSLQQVEHDQILKVVPVGIDSLVVSYRKNGISQLYNQPPLAFELTAGDFDNDGLSDRREVQLGTDIALRDTDGDGLTDGQEVLITNTDPLLQESVQVGVLDGDIDTDNDGLSDRIELNETDTNINSADLADQLADFDNDGLSNLIEVSQLLTNPSLKDTDSNGIDDGSEDFDQDGLTNLQELNDTGTDPTDSDSLGNGILDGDEDRDVDGLSDGLELNHINPDTNEPYYDFELSDSDANAVLDGEEDFDGDALSNRVEVELTLTNPWLADSDADGVNDGAEDTDSDGLTDSQEIYVTQTDFRLKDSNNDGTDDGDEDFDNDGLTDREELKYSSNHQNSDSDSDGLTDFDEIYTYGTNPQKKDTDDDGIEDNEEINTYGSDPSSADSDGDELSDLVELGIGNNLERPLYRSDPNIADTDGDGVRDDEEFEFKFTYTDAELIEFGYIEPDYYVDPYLGDTDSDGLTDFEEIDLNLNPALSDTDNDKLSDYDEYHGTYGFKTKPKEQDTDQDGLKDGDEILVTETDPLDTDSNDNGILDSDEDRDQDGLSDAAELYLTLTTFDVPDSDNNGVPDGLEDPDGDELNNLQEVAQGTDPHNPDTDGDGIRDDKEVSGGGNTNPNISDSDEDGLSDGEEELLGTDPTLVDTDGDGLSDFDEVVNGSLPLDVDTDNDFLLDGDDLNVNLLEWDADGDGIPDGIEQHYLNTSPTSNDTDLDGLFDGSEVWVYAVAEDELIPAGGVILENQLVTIGSVAGTTRFNSRLGDANFNTVALTDNGRDRQVLTVVRVLEMDVDQNVPSETENITMYIRSVSKPDVADTDGDGLTDFTELMQIEREFGGTGNGDGFDPNVGTSSFNPNLLNSENFFISDPWVIDTPDENGVKNQVNDGDEDVDGDFYINVLEQANENSDVTKAHSDATNFGDPNDLGDGIPDGIEVELLTSSPEFTDTDEDGLEDHEELAGTFSPIHYDLKTGPIVCRVENRENNLGADVGCYDDFSSLPVISKPCRDTEVRLPNVAGVSYCFTIHFGSRLNDQDSDNDTVLDLDDAYALDSTCSIEVDGFTDEVTKTKQCFSSWMAQQDRVEQIDYAQWLDNGALNQSEIAFYSQGWDKIVRFDILESSYLPLSTSITSVDGAPLVKTAYSSLSRRLYLAYEDGSIIYIDLVTGVETPWVLANLNPDTVLDTIVVAGTSVIVQFKDTNDYIHRILNEAGQEGVPGLAGATDFNLTESLWDSNTSRLYGFQQRIGQSASNLGFVGIDSLNNQFTGGIVYSQSLASEAELTGPIALSQGGGFVYLGSGQKRLAELGLNDDIDPVLEKTSKGTLYNRFRELIELGDHFIAVVDVETASDPITPPIRNGILIEDFTSLNSTDFVSNHYLFEENEHDEVLKLIPYLRVGEPELAIVKRNLERVSIEAVGIVDADADGMTGIYESFYGLDNSDASDRFYDPDQDFLTNIEEFNLATDPLNEDTDGDSWSDSYEVINSTDPLDATDY